MSSDDHSRRRLKIWFWGILSLAILFALCIWLHGQSIPRDIQGRVRAALAAAGFDPAHLHGIDGRTVTLSGDIAENINRDQLIAAADSVRGVRRVVDNLRLARSAVKSAPLPVRQAQVSIYWEADQLVMQGEVDGADTIAKLLAAARQAAGAVSVENQLTVGQNVASAGWVEPLAGLIPSLSDVKSARIDAAADGLTLSGFTESEDIRTAFLQNARQAAGEIKIFDRLELIQPQKSASLSLELSENKLVLSGELPGKTDIDRVLAAVENQFGNRELVNQLIASESAANPAWLDGALQLFGYLANVDGGGIAVSDRIAVLAGTVAGQDQMHFISRRAQALLGDLPLDNRIKVKTPVVTEPEPVADLPDVLPTFPPLYFRHDSTQIVEASRPVLDEVIELLKRFPALKLEVGGHTDSAGDDIYNRDLSLRRAQDMVQFLAAAGIDAQRLIPRGDGETQPIANNSTSAGRAENRRIELKVLK